VDNKFKPTLLDRVVGYFSPQAAHERARARWGTMALFEAAERSRLRRDNSTRTISINQDIERAGGTLRAKARFLEQNYDVVAGALDVLETNIVGAGIMPEPSITDVSGRPMRELNRQIRAIWDDWQRGADASGARSMYGQQRLGFRSKIRDGEAFGQLLQGNVAGLRRPPDYAGGAKHVPLWLELIEADLCPLDFEQQGARQGISHDRWGRPTRYWFYTEHPGDAMGVPEIGSKPADSIVHAKFASRIGQIRGSSRFASAINRLEDIASIDESERVAARVAAAMTGFITRSAPEDYDVPEGDEDYARMAMEPGMIHRLQPGENVGTIQSNRPNNELIPFRQDMMRGVAGGVGISYSTLSKNYNGTYSAQRQELVEQYGVYGLMWADFVEEFCDPIYRAFVSTLLASKIIDVPLQQIDPRSLFAADHSRPAMPWIDPHKEMRGVHEALAMRIDSWSSVIKRRGQNPDKVRQQIEADIEDMRERGIAPAEGTDLYDDDIDDLIAEAIGEDT